MTIQFSTKNFPQADLQSAKHIKSGLKSLLAQSTDCLVLGYSKQDFEGFAGSKNAKAKSGVLHELDTLLGGSLTHAKLLGELDGVQGSACLLKSGPTWSATAVKAKRVLLLNVGDQQA